MPLFASQEWFDAFVDAINAIRGQVASCEFVLETGAGAIDPNQIGMSGHSFGGYAALVRAPAPEPTSLGERRGPDGTSPGPTSSGRVCQGSRRLMRWGYMSAL